MRRIELKLMPIAHTSGCGDQCHSIQSTALPLSALSRLVGRAAELQEQNDLTI
jgi:hypothetical protein